MRRLVLTAALILVLAVLYRTMGSPATGTGGRIVPTLPGPDPNPGAPAPTFVHERYDGGGTFDLSDRGVYVLTFWDTLNRDSNLAQPYFAHLADDFEGSGVHFVAVYIGDPPEEAEPAPYAIVVDSDGKLAAMYNVKRVPRIFIVSDGLVHTVQNTFVPENYDLLRDDLSELVSSEEEAPNSADGPK